MPRPEIAKTTAGIPDALIDARKGGSAPDRYVVPSATDREKMTELVAALCKKRGNVATLTSGAASLGFRFEDVPSAPGVVLLRETERERRGGGAYAFRRNASSHLVVQAPHTLFDEGTLPLAWELFERSRAAALFIDTAHRYKAAEVDERGQNPADVAHATDSLFQAATEGLLSTIKSVTVVQLHGFGPRESDAVAVVSTGSTNRDDAFLAAAKERLGAAAQGRVDRFPDDTGELGATLNVQGALVRQVGGRFLHVEMSAPLRSALGADADRRARFLDALALLASSP